jgi:hypothetical protein
MAHWLEENYSSQSENFVALYVVQKHKGDATLFLNTKGTLPFSWKDKEDATLFLH